MQHLKEKMKSAKFLFFLNFFSEALEYPNPDCSEHDLDLAQQCEKICNDEAIMCLDQCPTCQRQCTADYLECSDSCPCYDYCYDGCIGCENIICQNCLENGNNEIYFKQCISRASKTLDSCVQNCTVAEICHENCLSNYISEAKLCPCMENCPQGCPCKEGDHCERQITLMCEHNYEGGESFLYAITESGLLMEKKYYTLPIELYGHNRALADMGYAIINGEAFLFGGDFNDQKIVRLVGCSFEKLPQRLNNGFKASVGSITTVLGTIDVVILCNGGYPTKTCESFDGNTVANIQSTIYEHLSGCMATYHNEATIIAGRSDYTKVETLSLSGWREQPEQLVGLLEYHSCLSVDNAIIVTGGIDRIEVTAPHNLNVLLFKAGVWSIVGNLKASFSHASMISLGNTLWIVDGISSFKLERIIWNGEEVGSSEIIEQHNINGACSRPILFESLPLECTEHCNDFCYAYQHDFG